MGPSEARACVTRAYALGACQQLDAGQHAARKGRRIGKLIELSGIENLEAALALGCGAILYSGHVYGVMTFFLRVAKLGRPINMITLPESREPLAGQRFKQRRFEFITKEMGIRPLRLGSNGFGVAATARNALRRNEIVTIVIDQSVSLPQIEVPFLNGHSLFPLGPVLLSQASAAPLVPFWIRRDLSSMQQIAEIGPMHFPSDDPALGLQDCVRWIDEHIRADPGSWSLWLHPSCNLLEQ